MERFIPLLITSLLSSVTFVGSTSAIAEQYSGGGITLSLPDNHSSFTATSGCANATTMTLQAPARFVVDCPRRKSSGKKATAEYSISPSRHAVVEGIRFGAHADKVRIVFDLRAATPVDFTTKGAAGFTLSFTKDTPKKTVGAKQKTAKPPSDQVSILPVGTPQLVETTPSDAVGKVAEPTSPLKATPTQQLIDDFDLGISDSPTARTDNPAAEQPPIADERASMDPVTIPEVSAGPRRLSNLVFDYLPPAGEPVLRLILSKPGEFKLLRKGDQGAVITIPSCSLAGNHLTLPHFPPEDFTGFTVVEVSSEANSCVIRMGTERNIRLAPYTKDNEIQVRRAAG